MKKFNFSLQSLCDYKEHLFEYEKNVLSQLHMKLEQQMVLRSQKQNEYCDCQRKIADKMAEGLTVGELMALKAYLTSIEKQIEEITGQIETTKIKINNQTKAVLVLKTEQAALNKLRDKQWEFYSKDAEKEQEKLIDEFVTSRVAE